jgi:hypothetical protein
MDKVHNQPTTHTGTHTQSIQSPITIQMMTNDILLHSRKRHLAETRTRLRAAMGGNRRLNGLQTIHGRGWLRREFNLGVKVDMAEGGRQMATAWGKKMGLTGGVHMPGIGKGENTSVKLCNLAQKAHSTEDAKDAQLTRPVKEAAAYRGGMG